MLTLENRTHPLLIKGLSSDTKPTTTFEGYMIKNGDNFLEMNTGSLFFFNEDTKTWIEPS